MKFPSLILSAVAAIAGLSTVQLRADKMASIAVSSTGVVTLTPQWAIGSSLSGFKFASQDLSYGGGPSNFYSMTALTTPTAGAFTYYGITGTSTPQPTVNAGLTANSYSALTLAAPDLGYGSNHFYTIHHTSIGDYLSVIKPAVSDLKTMGAAGSTGYFGLTFSATDLGSGANIFYYLRADPNTGFGILGSLVPAQGGVSADLFNLGIAGFNALAYTSTAITTQYGANQMYYLRLDPITGFTILGALSPVTGKMGDIANLGSVYSTLDFDVGDIGFGVGTGGGNFYSTGPINATGQTVSFAAMASPVAISAGAFTVSPSASSGLAIALTVVAGSTGTASISGPNSQGAFTVTPTGPGVITLQATQAGQVGFEFNMLRQSFTATGVAIVAPVITNSQTVVGATAGTPFNFAITAVDSPTSYSASPLPTGLTIDSATGVISGTPATAGTTAVTLGATNASGTTNAGLSITVAAANGAPALLNSGSSLAPTIAVGTPYTFGIVASGSPSSYSASPLPAGLSIDTSTGVISGTPSTAGTTPVTIGATNGHGTQTTTLTITVAGAPSSRIVNFSARALSGPGDKTLILGFVVSGNGMNLLVRGIGPTLGSLGVANFLADPFLTMYGSNGTVLATNDNWGTTSGGVDDAAQITTIDTQVGAFALPSGSLDSALLITVNNGPNTTGLVRANSTTGIALVELYDTGSPIGTRLVNVSARMNVTAGNGVLIAGVVISGNASKTVLIRGVGPALSALGVSGVLADPMITVFSAGTVIASNAGWSTGASTPAQVSNISAQVGAFPLPAGSNDAALILTLHPGVYSVQVTSVSNGTGVALIEVYDTQ